MFNLIVILLITINTLEAAEKKDSTKCNKNIYSIGIQLISTLHTPINHFGDLWKPYPTFGLKVDLPTYIPKLFIQFTGETGFIKNKDDSIEKIDLLHASVTVSYALISKNDILTIRPAAGMSNMIMNVWDLDEDNFLDLPAGKSENEFGFTGGAEIGLKLKRFLITVPVMMNIILSSPEPFTTFEVSLAAGVTL